MPCAATRGISGSRKGCTETETGTRVQCAQRTALDTRGSRYEAHRLSAHGAQPTIHSAQFMICSSRLTGANDSDTHHRKSRKKGSRARAPLNVCIKVRQLMFRRSGSWSGEAASMSICNLTMLMAVAAASSPLLPWRPPQRSSACCMSLTVSTPNAIGIFH